MDKKLLEKISNNIITDMNLLLFDYNINPTDEEIINFIIDVIERQEKDNSK